MPVIDPLSEPVSEYAVDASRVLDGSPRPSMNVIWESQEGVVHAGIWEMSAGTLGGVDVDELVHVICGHVTVTFDATGETLELRTGDLVTFSKGQTMTWQVHDRFRAVFAGR